MKPCASLGTGTYGAGAKLPTAPGNRSGAVPHTRESSPTGYAPPDTPGLRQLSSRSKESDSGPNAGQNHVQNRRSCEPRGARKAEQSSRGSGRSRPALRAASEKRPRICSA